MEEKFTNYIKKKKICFVLRSYYKYRLGGAELQAYFIARELYEKCWEVHYVFDKSGILQREFDDGIVFNNKRLWLCALFSELLSPTEEIKGYC